MMHPELLETELAPPGAAQPAGDADATASSSAQQVLDAIAHAVSLDGRVGDGSAGDGSTGPSALAPVGQVAVPAVAVPEVAVVVRRRTDARPSAQPEPPPSGEQAVLDDLASATAGLKLAALKVREQFLRLADIEIRKTLGLAAEPGPARQRASVTAPSRERGGVAEPRERGTPDVPAAEAAEAAHDPAFAPEAGRGNAWEPRASAPGELYEGTVRLLVMANGNVQRIVQFVDELCQMPQFRMLRMTGSRQQDGAEISLGLREPLPLARIVASMPNVVRVDVRSPDEAVADGGIGVTVHLAPTEGDDLDLAPMLPSIEPDA
ncbi:MAG: hypothetical protein IIC95_02400 [Chloroflexi bacterium]|nr:hypothetical protein [Chloroflexota bacterium]MCH7654819.1 hypothetical protein [Chloroflexota bacterium]